MLMLFNPFEGAVSFQIPQFGEGGWVLELTAGKRYGRGSSPGPWITTGRAQYYSFRRP